MKFPWIRIKEIHFEEDEDILGEVYVYPKRGGAYGRWPRHYSEVEGEPSWKQFKYKDRDFSKDNNGFICIWDMMHKTENTIVYDEFLFEKERIRIQKGTS